MGAKRMRVVAIFSVLVGATLLVAPAGAEDPSGDPGAIVEQNLFHPSRSVPAPPPPPEPKAPPTPVAAPAPPPPPPKFVLSGVAIQENAAMALLQEPGLTQNKVVLVSRGEQVGPYRLTDVQADRVTLQSPTKTLTVLLFDPNKPKLAPSRAALIPRGPSGESPASAPGAPQIERRKQGKHGARGRHGAQDDEAGGTEAPPPAGGKPGGGKHGGEGKAGGKHGEGRPSGAENPLSALPRANPKGGNPFGDAFRALQQGQSPGQEGQ